MFLSQSKSVSIQKVVPILLVVMLIVLFFGNVFAYSAFDDNYLVEADGFYDSAVIAADGNISARIIIASQPIGVYSDNNNKVILGVYFDDNAPNVSINYPSDGRVFSSNNIPMTYTTVNPDLVIKYYVKLDDLAWIDNGLNKGYLFSNLSIGRHVFYVKAVDAFGLIGESSVIIFIRTQSTGTDETDAERDRGGSEPNVIDITNEYTQEFDLTEKNIASTALNELGSGFFGDSRIAGTDEVKLIRTIKMRIVRMEDTIVSTDVNFQINITNASGKDLENVSIVESISKKLASDSNKVSFMETPKIIKQDPVVEWTIPLLSLGSETSRQYSINGISDENILSDLNSFFAGLPTPTPLLPLAEQDLLCKTMTCNDDNPCTEDYCVKGNCFYSSKNGASCGDFGVCQKTVCKENSQKGIFADFNNQYKQLFLITIIGIVAIIVILLGIFVFIIRDKRKETKKKSKRFRYRKEKTHFKHRHPRK